MSHDGRHGGAGKIWLEHASRDRGHRDGCSGAQILGHMVEREGGCVVWGGAMHLSPADDILIRVERPLDLDSVPRAARRALAIA